MGQNLRCPVAPFPITAQTESGRSPGRAPRGWYGLLNQLTRGPGHKGTMPSAAPATASPGCGPAFLPEQRRSPGSDVLQHPDVTTLGRRPTSELKLLTSEAHLSAQPSSLGPTWVLPALEITPLRLAGLRVPSCSQAEASPSTTPPRVFGPGNPSESTALAQLASTRFLFQGVSDGYIRQCRRGANQAEGARPRGDAEGRRNGAQVLSPVRSLPRGFAGHLRSLL